MSLREKMEETSLAGKPPRKVDTKEWGTVYVRKVSFAEIEQQDNDSDEVKALIAVVGQRLAAAGVIDPNKESRIAGARGAARVICDESGNKEYDEYNADDVFLLATQPWELISSVLREKDEGN